MNKLNKNIQDPGIAAIQNENNIVFWVKFAAMIVSIADNASSLLQGIIKKFSKVVLQNNPIATGIGGALMIANYIGTAVKDIASIYKKGGEFRTAEKSVNIGVIVGLIVLSSLIIAFSPLSTAFMVGIAALTLVLQSKHLIQMLFKNYAMKKRILLLKDEQEKTANHLQNLQEMLNHHLSLSKESKFDDKHEQTELEKYRGTFIDNTKNEIDRLEWKQRCSTNEINALNATVSLRRYKIARDIAGVSLSVCVLVGVIIALSLGPIGWSIVGAAAVIGIVFQIGIYIHHRKYACKNAIEKVKLLKKTSDYDATYKHALSELTRGVVREPKLNAPKHRNEYRLNKNSVTAPTNDETSDTKKVHFSDSKPTLFYDWNQEQQNNWKNLEKTNISNPVPKHIGYIEL